MILARPFFGTLDIAIFLATAGVVLLIVVRRNWRKWIDQFRAWFKAHKAKLLAWYRAKKEKKSK
jgi:hypothetical protein